MGVCTHIVLSALSFTTVYIIISCGVDLTPVLDTVGLSSLDKKDSAASTAGSFLIAYTIYKLIAPLRWPLTFAVTPVVMRTLRRRGYMLPKTKSKGNAAFDRVPTSNDQISTPMIPESKLSSSSPRPVQTKSVSTRKQGPN